MTPPLALALALLSPREALEQTGRSAQTIGERVIEREDLLRRRIAALYRFARGGAARLLAESADPLDASMRIEAARRVIRRDIDEIAALRRERDDLSAMRAELVARVARLETARGATSALDSRKGRLAPPVAAATGPKPALGGLVFRAAPRAPVRAVGAGRVLHVGPIPGFDLVVLLDHGGGLVSLYAQMGETAVGVEDYVREGALLGRVAERALYFELRRNAEPVSASAWFRRR